MIVAEPRDEKAVSETTDEYRTTMAIAMACRIDALAIGRCDEALSWSPADGSPMRKYNRKLARTDPTVRTCVVTEAVALGGSEEITIIAKHGLDDTGQHLWDVSETRNSTMATLVPLWAARNLIDEGPSEIWRDQIALDQFSEQIRWEVRQFPEIVTW